MDLKADLTVFAKTAETWQGHEPFAGGNGSALLSKKEHEATQKWFKDTEGDVC